MERRVTFAAADDIEPLYLHTPKVDGSAVAKLGCKTELEESDSEAVALAPDDDLCKEKESTASLTSSGSSMDLVSPKVVTGKRRPKKSNLRKSSSPVSKKEARKLAILGRREENAVSFVKAGELVEKWTYSQKKLKRFMKVSEDGNYLEINSKKAWKFTDKVRRIDLEKVQRVIYGPRTMAFEEFDWRNDKAWRCFSVVTADRTWDFKASSDESAMQWFFGLQTLCAPNKGNLTWGKLLWMKILLKTIRISFKEGCSADIIFTRLVMVAKNAEVRRVLFSDDFFQVELSMTLTAS